MVWVVAGFEKYACRSHCDRQDKFAREAWRKASRKEQKEWTDMHMQTGALEKENTYITKLLLLT